MNRTQARHRWDRRGRISAPLRPGRLLLAALALAVLVLQASAAAADEPAHGWSVRVRNAACVPGQTVHLGEIADMAADMPAERRTRLAATALWAAPEKAGHQTALSRERLHAMLQHYLGDEASGFVLPQQLVVQRGGRAIDGATLERMGVDFLTAEASGLRGEVEITGLRAPDYVFLPHPGDRVKLVMSEPVRPGRNNLLYEVVSGEGRTARRFAATAFLNVWRPVACATRPINRLEAVTPDMVSFQRKNVAFYQNAWDGSGGPWRVARSVGTNQVITVDSVEPVPVIAKGGTVNLVYEGANIRLSVKAVALADAGIGQTVQVRNVQSKRKIVGIVQDAETVVVR